MALVPAGTPKTAATASALVTQRTRRDIVILITAASSEIAIDSTIKALIEVNTDVSTRDGTARRPSGRGTGYEYLCFRADSCHDICARTVARYPLSLHLLRANERGSPFRLCRWSMGLVRRVW